MHEIVRHLSGSRHDSDAGQSHTKSLSLGKKISEQFTVRPAGLTVTTQNQLPLQLNLFSVHQQGGPDIYSSLHGGCTAKTGQEAFLITLSATDPTNMVSSPLRQWVAMTII